MTMRNLTAGNLNTFSIVLWPSFFLHGETIPKSCFMILLMSSNHLYAKFSMLRQINGGYYETNY